MRIVLVILILGIVLGAYLFYVRGGGVQPEGHSPLGRDGLYHS